MQPLTRFERLLAALIQRRVAVAVVAVGVVAVFSVCSARLQVKNDLQSWFVAGDPALVEYQSFRARFGSDEVIVVGVGHDDSVVHHLPELAALTARLQRIQGVERVASLSSAVVVDADEHGVALRPFADHPQRALDDARAHHGLLARLVSRDDKMALVWLWLGDDERGGTLSDAARAAAVRDVEAAVAPLRATATVRVVGGGVVWEALNALTLRDGAVFIGLAYLVVIAGLWLVTRRGLWIAVAVAAVSCANTVLLGTMALLDVPMNAVTVCLPSLVMALSILDILHIAGELDALGEESGDGVDAQRARQARALAVVVAPGFFNVLTTVVGLLALLTATTAVTQQLGGFAALGVACAWVFSLVFSLLALPRALRHRRKSARKSRGLVERLAAWSIARRGVVGGASVVVAAAAGLGIARLDVDTATLGFLPDDHVVVTDTRAVEAAAGPFVPMELKIDVDGSWQRASLIAALDRAAARVDDVVVGAGVDVGRAVSAVDVVTAGVYALTGEHRLPRNDDEVAAALALVALADEHALDGLVARDGHGLRFTVPVTLTTARGFVDAGAAVAAIVEEEVGLAGHVGLTGYLPLYGRIVQSLVDDQLVSFAVAFFGVFVLIGLFLRSFRLLLVAALPNLLPVAAVLGLMGAVGIRLDVATITIAATVLGVVVDDTVHTLHRIRHGLCLGLDVRAAILAASRVVGRANLGGNLVLAAGFGVLGFAAVKSVSLVGVLSAVAIGAALVADLVVVPAIASMLLQVKK